MEKGWAHYFSYVPSTGDLLWKCRPVSEFKTPREHSVHVARRVGNVVGTKLSRHGRPHRIELTLHTKHYKAQRIVWELHNGPIPSGLFVDHINGNPWDNRLENLRLATPAQNTRNTGIRKTNTSGAKGVSFNVKAGKFVATIRDGTKQIHLGSFDTLDAASEAYRKSAQQLHGEYARI